MKIAISGAQSTGKTTLINELKKIYQVTFKTEITRDRLPQIDPIDQHIQHL